MNGGVIILIINNNTLVVYALLKISRRKIKSHGTWFTTILVKSLTKFMVD